VLVPLGIAEIDRALAVPVQIPARRAPCARPPVRPRPSLLARGSRHALLTLRPRRALRPERALIAVRHMRALRARRARGARGARRPRRALRALRTRGTCVARRTLGTRAVRLRSPPLAVLVLVPLGVAEIDGARAVAVEVPARR